jgi:hypothetical protein
MASRYAEHEIELSPNLPPFTRGDLAAILVGILGTIVAIVLAATGPGVQSAAGAAQILIAIGISLINMSHVVGLLLFESVDYHGAGQSTVQALSLVATPAAVSANLVLSLAT